MQLPPEPLGRLLLVGVSGCSSFSDPSEPTGVDLLTIPTPSPEPADFVDVVDNPWFTLDPVAGPDILGVATTARETTINAALVTDFFAQDTRRQRVVVRSRQACGRPVRSGAEAGLLMAAEPREGDGYRTAAGIGGDPRATVLSVSDDQVVLELVAPDGTTEEQTFRRRPTA